MKINPPMICPWWLSMRSETLQKFAVVWLAIWFGVIVPGHKRGLVLLPGGEPPAKTQTSTGEPCPLAEIMALSGSCCPSSKSSGNTPGPSAPVTHCAVCYLTGVLDVPPLPDFAPKPLALVQVLPWPSPDEVESVTPLQTYLGRAPPLG